MRRINGAQHERNARAHEVHLQHERGSVRTAALALALAVSGVVVGAFGGAGGGSDDDERLRIGAVHALFERAERIAARANDGGDGDQCVGGGGDRTGCGRVRR